MSPNITSRRLNEELETAISNNPYLQRNKLRFENESGHVILIGEVGSYYQSQMAQESIKQIEGVVEVDNQLEVTTY